MNSIKFLMVAGVIVMLAGAASAVQTPITVYDGYSAGSNPWHNSTIEDEEVEPDNLGSQGWDLEGFLLDEDTQVLTMVGGFNFKDGKDGVTSGDVFFSTSGDVLYGVAAQGLGNDAFDNQIVDNEYGYEIGVRLNYANNTYAAYHLVQDSTLMLADVYYARNSGSDPWKMDNTWLATQVAFATGSFSFESNASQYALENGGLYAGGANAHYAVNLDLTGIIAANSEFTVHFTMGCGNDDLIGHYPGVSVPDAGAASLLFGLGLMGIGACVRRFK